MSAVNAAGESGLSSSTSGYADELTQGSWTPSEDYGYEYINEGSYYDDQTIYNSPDYVYYKVWMHQGDTYRVHICGYSYDDDPDLFIYSSYGDSLTDSRNSAGFDEVIDYYCQDSGYYYLCVVNSFGYWFDFSIGVFEL